MSLTLPHPEKELVRLHTSGEYTQLIECARANLEYVLDEYGFEHQYAGIAALQLARWLYDQRDYEAAERQLLDALVVDIADRDELKERNATIQLDLAQLYVTTGRFVDAESAVDRATSLVSSMNVEKPALQATIAFHRARILSGRGDFAAAQSLLLQAIDITAPDVGPKHRKLGVMYDILSRVYEQQGKLVEAEQAIRQALDSYAAREIAQYAWSLYTLAKYLVAQSRTFEAEGYLLQAIGIANRVRPAGHPDIDRFEQLLAELRSAT